MFLEPFSNRLYHFLANTKPQATNTAYVIEYSNDRTLNIISNTITLGATASFGTSPNSESILTYFHSTGASDQRGDLNIMQHRGMFHVQLKNPGRNINSATPTAISRFVLHHPSPNPSNSNKLAGYISKCFETANGVSAAVQSAASTDLKNPSNYSYTNGIRVFNNFYLGNTENRIQVQNNYFAMYSVGGYPTSRILIKA